MQHCNIVSPWFRLKQTNYSSENTNFCCFSTLLVDSWWLTLLCLGRTMWRPWLKESCWCGLSWKLSSKLWGHQGLGTTSRSKLACSASPASTVSTHKHTQDTQALPLLLTQSTAYTYAYDMILSVIICCWQRLLSGTVPSRGEGLELTQCGAYKWLLKYSHVSFWN